MARLLWHNDWWWICGASHVCVLMGTYGDRPNHNQDAEAQWHLWFLPLGEQACTTAQSTHLASGSLESSTAYTKCTHIWRLYIELWFYIQYRFCNTHMLRCIPFLCTVHLESHILFCHDFSLNFKYITSAGTFSSLSSKVLICSFIKLYQCLFNQHYKLSHLLLCSSQEQKSSCEPLSHDARHRVHVAPLFYPPVHGPPLWAEGLLGLWEGVWCAGPANDDEGRRGWLSLWASGSPGAARLSLWMPV